MEKMLYIADELIGIILSLQENIAQMTQNRELILEQIAILCGQCFGRHSEKMNVIQRQISLFFNEPEAAVSEQGIQAEESKFKEATAISTAAPNQRDLGLMLCRATCCRIKL